MDWGFLKIKYQEITDYLKTKLSLFIEWREKRIVRFHHLPLWRKTVNVIITMIALFLFYLILVDINFMWLFGKSPSIRAIANPPQSLTSEIISADDKIIGKYFTENRSLVKFNEISPALVNTLISTEDRRFYKHFGIDIHGLGAAMYDALRGNPRGASTISQQLVKNMYKTRTQYSIGILGRIPGFRLIIEKTKEWIGALKLEIFYSKHDILTMYLNTVSFGSNAYGVNTAAKTYFNTTPDKLTYEQSAVLIGLLKGITIYNPYYHKDNALKRRNLILNLLAKNGYLSTSQVDSLANLPMVLNYNVEKSNEGIAPYFRAYLTRYLEYWGEANGYDIYADGLKIYVTIDSRMQKYAEDAVEQQMKIIQDNFFSEWSVQNPWRDENGEELAGFIENIAKNTPIYKSLAEKYKNNTDSINYYLNEVRPRKVFDYKAKGHVSAYEMSVLDSIRYMNHFLHCGFVAMEPDTRNVKAWVGDIDYNYWKYDKVEQSERQPGSTFKLFVYTAGLRAGKSPCDRIVDEPFTWQYDGDKVWTPKNYSRRYTYSSMTLKRAFAQSVNTVAARLAQEVGIPNVIETAHLLGIKSKLLNLPTTSLGASEVNLLEMVNSFSTIIDEGMYHLPLVVTKIVDKDGYVIYEDNVKPKRVITYENAFLMTNILQGGLTEPGGTSRALWGYDLMRWNTDFGGKTGTSSNYADAWYIGVTPNLVAGAWVGGESPNIHFRNGNYGQASRTALPVYARFMEKVLADNNLKKYRAKFPTVPKEPILRPYNCEPEALSDSTMVNDSIDVNELDTMSVDNSNINNQQETKELGKPEEKQENK